MTILAASLGLLGAYQTIYGDDGHILIRINLSLSISVETDGTYILIEDPVGPRTCKISLYNVALDVVEDHMKRIANRRHDAMMLKPPPLPESATCFYCMADMPHEDRMFIEQGWTNSDGTDDHDFIAVCDKCFNKYA